MIKFLQVTTRRVVNGVMILLFLEKSGSKTCMDDDEETDSSGSVSDSAANETQEGRPHVCDVCDLRYVCGTTVIKGIKATFNLLAIIAM